jgi:membrane protein
MLSELALVLESKLGMRLDQIYPPVADDAADTKETPA